jgi:anti-sigma-K factor RskA
MKEPAAVRGEIRRRLQLWTLWDKQKGPVSAGLIDRTRSARFERADLPQ